MARRGLFTGLTVFSVILSGILAVSAQTTPATPPPATPPVLQSPGGSTPAPPDMNTPSGDASNAQEITLAARPTLTIRGESNWDDGYTALLNAFKGLRAEAKRLGLTVVGPPQAIFTQTDDAGFKFEAIVILDQNPDIALKPLNKMTFSKSPDGRAFVFQHVGAYDDIDSTYEAITAWLDEKGLESKGAFVEEYLNEPEGSDDALLKLNIYVFIK